MKSNRKVSLTGRLGKDPYISTLPNGSKVAHMCLATQSPDNDPKGSNTQWHTLVAWAIQASIAEKHLSKGRKIKVEGTLEHHSYTDKRGVLRKRSNVRVHHIQMLDAKPLAA